VILLANESLISEYLLPLSTNSGIVISLLNNEMIGAPDSSFGFGLVTAGAMGDCLCRLNLVVCAVVDTH